MRPASGGLLFGTAVSAAGLILALAPGPASAAGTRMGPARIVLTGEAAPGRTYSLESMYVANTGAETATYGIRVERLKSSPRKLVPRGWVALGTSHVDLGPGQATTIPIILHVPSDAADGDYLTNVVAASSGPATTDSTGVAFGAGAAADVVFTIRDNSQALARNLLLASLALMAMVGILLYSQGFRIRVVPRASADKPNSSSPP